MGPAGDHRGCLGARVAEGKRRRCAPRGLKSWSAARRGLLEPGVAGLKLDHKFRNWLQEPLKQALEALEAIKCVADVLALRFERRAPTCSLRYPPPVCSASRSPRGGSPRSTNAVS